MQQHKLEPQLSLLPEMVQAMGYDTSRFDIADLLGFFQSLGNARKLLLSEICILAKLMLVLSATNAVSERSFFSLKRVKIPGSRPALSHFLERQSVLLFCN